MIRRIYDILFYPNSVDPASYRATDLPIAYEHNSLGGEGTTVAFFNDLVDVTEPSQARVDAVLADYTGYTGLICLDIERWNNWGAGGAAAAAAAQTLYLNTLAKCRIRCPSAGFGYYNMGPTIYSNTHWIAAYNAGVLATMRVQSGYFSTLSAAMDAFFPSAYTVELSFRHWFVYVDQGIKECIRIDPSKPRYPFICPEYLNVSGHNNELLPITQWRREMNYIRDRCDGFVVWGGDAINTIDYNSTWWTALEENVTRLTNTPIIS